MALIVPQTSVRFNRLRKRYATATQCPTFRSFPELLDRQACLVPSCPPGSRPASGPDLEQADQHSNALTPSAIRNHIIVVRRALVRGKGRFNVKVVAANRLRG